MSSIYPWRPIPPGGPLYQAIRWTTWAVGSRLTRPQIVGAERLPRRGGLLVVSNHASLSDPLILVAACPRPLTFMAKEELLRAWYARMAARLTGGAFPVRRGQNDVRAVRSALDLIRGGSAIVVFPEGTRHPEGLGEAHPGVSYIATRGGCPVLPVAIVGSEALSELSSVRGRPPIEVRFGEPFVPDSSGDSRDIATDIMERIAALLPASRRGVYGLSREAAHAG